MITDQVGRSKNARLIPTFLSSQLKSPFSKELISAIQEKAIEIGVIDSVSSDASDEGKPFSSSLDLEAKRSEKRDSEEENRARIALISEIAADLRLMRNDVGIRANRAFNFLIAFATVATASILVAIGLAAYGKVPAAVISTFAGLLSGGTAAIFRKVYITFSTPARLYQERSKSTISPAVGRCAT